MGECHKKKRGKTGFALQELRSTLPRCVCSMVLGSFYQLFAGTIVPNTFIRPPDSPGVIVFSRPPMSPMAFLGPPVGALAGNHLCSSPGHKRGLRPPIQGPSNAHKVCTCCQGLGVGVGGMPWGRDAAWTASHVEPMLWFVVWVCFVWFGFVVFCRPW